MRILNMESLCSHGNVAGRKVVLDILEAGLQASDPYYNTLKVMRIEGGRLIVGHPDFEPSGSPKMGEETYDLAEVGKILVVGAGKGVQRVAKAIEEVLRDHLAGGHVIVKHGDEVDLERIGVTFGGHPVPDEGCVEGCQRILELIRGLRKEDLVFTVAANGISALLTLPVPGVSLEDVRRTTYLMQIERGVPTRDLNCIRNHIDLLKGGKISRYLQPARAVHILAWDPEGNVDAWGSSGYDRLTRHNRFLHPLPDSTTFEEAVSVLSKWRAWDDIPSSVKRHLVAADPSGETVKAEEFERTDFRIFGVMPRRLGVLPVAGEKAMELGYKPYTLCDWLHAEASHAGVVIGNIALSIEREGVPFEPPCVLLTRGELLVTVGQEKGVGGRNQEYALSAARVIAGSQNIVMGAVDTDGNDGPGAQFVEGEEAIPTLAGGIVDGETVEEALAVGVDIERALREHNTTPALLRLDSGIRATYNISLTDLGVTLIMGRKSQA